MSLSSYEYDRGNRGSGTGRLRTVMIFIATLCVIGAGIYFLLPHQDKEPSSGNSPGEAGPKVISPGENIEGGASGNGNAPAGNGLGGNPAPETGNGNSSSDAAGTSAEQSGQTTEQTTDPGSSAVAPSAESTAVGPANADPETGAGASQPTEVPQKGKPWIGDPPEHAPAAAGGSEADRLLVPDVQREMQILRVRAGDSLSRLAVRHHTTVEALRHYNGLSKDVIRIGQKLRFIPGPWRISVDKKSRILTVERCRDGVWSAFASFAVGLGRFNSTPTAEFVISTRLRHPDWYTGDGRIYRYGDTENQLGDYFLKLAPAGSPEKPLRGYGIHGTPDEGSVGKNWSNGCIRMHNREVELLYYLVPSGTPVTILPGAENTPSNGELKHD